MNIFHLLQYVFIYYDFECDLNVVVGFGVSFALVRSLWNSFDVCVDAIGYIEYLGSLRFFLFPLLPSPITMVICYRCFHL